MKMKTLITALFLIFLLVCTSAAVNSVNAKDGKGKSQPKIRIAFSGDTMTSVASKVMEKALDDKAKVFERSEWFFGILRAEINLANEHGDEKARENAKKQIAYLKDDFFADIWIHFNVNETTGMTTVTIKSGNQTTTMSFPTPHPTDYAGQDARAQEVYNAAMALYNS